MLIELTIGLPDTHFRPASITLHLELSTITGMRAMSGSAAMRLRKIGHRLLGVEQGLVHVDVDDLRAVLDLVARDLDRGIIVAGEDQLLELGRAGDVAALADVDEPRAGAGLLHFEASIQAAMHHRLEAGEQRVARGQPGRARGVQSRAAPAIAAICCGVVPQQPPTTLTSGRSTQSRTCAAVSSAASS